MALFGSKKKTEVTAKSATTTAPVSKDLTQVLMHPRITEKASFSMEGNVYTFEVGTKATKREIAAAIGAMYKVTPLKVNVVAIPKKRVFVRGKWGVRGGGKKAYVYLKKGETIEIM